MARDGTRRRADTSAKRDAGIRLLLSGEAVADVADMLGVGKRTVDRWKASSAYVDGLAEKRAAIRAATENDNISIAEACGNAVLVMGRRLKHMADNYEPGSEDAGADAQEASNLFRAMAAAKIELTGKDGGAIEVDHGQPLDVVMAQYAAIKGDG